MPGIRTNRIPRCAICPPGTERTGTISPTRWGLTQTMGPEYQGRWDLWWGIWRECIHPVVFVRLNWT